MAFQGGLGFVSDLSNDISSYLLQGGARRGGPSVLCYSRPPETEEDRWREAREVGSLWTDGGDLVGGAAGAGTSSSSTAPPPGAAAAAAPLCFGAPPRSTAVRWPPRPQEEELARFLACGSPERGRGGGESGGESDHSGFESAESGASEGGRGRRVDGDGRRVDRLASGSPPVPGGITTLEAWLAAGTSEPQELLEFTSCFESANLRFALYNIEDAAYDLVLDNDVHTRGHTQWYYFAVRNSKPGQTVRFRIINMSKAKSLYRYGMRPWAWSEARAAEEAIACEAGTAGGPSRAEWSRHWRGMASRLWQPAGMRVRYYRTPPRHDVRGFSSGGYTLAFDYTFGAGHRSSALGSVSGDVVYIAMCFPFTYSMLRTNLRALARDPVTGPLIKFRCLCGTLGDVRCDLLEISNWSVSKAHKKSIVVSARVHPGEPGASWMVHGLIGFLLAPGPESQVLRNHFIWQVVPMMNPDGVICGNYRCGLCGVDLNRQWRRPSEALHGTVFALKRLIARSKRKAALCMYVDLHGHSRKHGLFSYACGQFGKDDYRRFTVRMFPRLLGMLTPEFEPANCRWRMGKGKRGTGRVVVAKDVGLVETYTIEASFYGAAAHKDSPEEALSGGTTSAAAAASASAAAGAGAECEGQTPAQGGPVAGSCSPSVSEGEDERGEVLNIKTVLFTPEKLEEFGANMARATLLLHQLSYSVQRCAQASARRGLNLQGCSPWPDVQFGMVSAPVEPSLAPPSESGSPESGSGGSGGSEQASDAEWEADEDFDTCMEGSDSLSPISPLLPRSSRQHSGGGSAPPQRRRPRTRGHANSADDEGATPSAAPESSPSPTPPPSCELRAPPPTAVGPQGVDEEDGEAIDREILERAGAMETLGPYFGIDTNELMLKLQGERSEDSNEAESPGSDSAPSEDNLGQDELTHLCRALKHQQKVLQRKRARLATATTSRASSGSKEKRGRQPAPRKCSDPPSRSGTQRKSLAPPPVETRSSRPDLHKVVAFGQTTYFKSTAPARGTSSGLAAGPAAGVRRDGVTSPQTRAAAAGSAALLATVPPPAAAASELDMLCIIGSVPAGARTPQQWPSIGRAEPKEAFVFFQPPKDRFAFSSRSVGSPSTPPGADGLAGSGPRSAGLGISLRRGQRDVSGTAAWNFPGVRASDEEGGLANRRGVIMRVSNSVLQLNGIGRRECRENSAPSSGIAMPSTAPAVMDRNVERLAAAAAAAAAASRDSPASSAASTSGLGFGLLVPAVAAIAARPPPLQASGPGALEEPQDDLYTSPTRRSASKDPSTLGYEEPLSTRCATAPLSMSLGPAGTRTVVGTPARSTPPGSAVHAVGLHASSSEAWGARPPASPRSARGRNGSADGSAVFPNSLGEAMRRTPSGAVTRDVLGAVPLEDALPKEFLLCPQPHR